MAAQTKQAKSIAAFTIAQPASSLKIMKAKPAKEARPPLVLNMKTLNDPRYLKENIDRLPLGPQQTKAAETLELWGFFKSKEAALIAVRSTYYTALSGQEPPMYKESMATALHLLSQGKDK